MAAGLLVDLAWKGTAVLLAAWGCARLVRRSPAAARHLVWSAALIALLVMPLLVLLGPVWQLEVLPVGADDAPVARTFMVREASRLSRAESRDKGSPNRVTTPGPVLPAAAIVLEPQEPIARTPVGREASQLSPSLPLVLAIIWAAGVLFGLLRLAVGLLWAGWIRRRACRGEACLAPTADWTRDVAEASALLGLTRRVPVYMSDRIGVPVTCGIIRPALLLPADADAWPHSRRRAVVLHELAHVARRDCLVQAIGHAARSLHWFNPLAFLALRRLRREQELACDDVVLGVGVSAVDYARHLCDVAGAMRSMSSPEWATLAMARPSNLEARVTSVLDDRVRRPAPRRAYRAAGALIVAGVLPFSALRLSAVTTPVLPAAAPRMTPSLPAPTAPAVIPVADLIESAQHVARTFTARLANHKGSRHVDQEEAMDMPDFSGTWILDDARSGSPTARQVDSSRVPQWGDMVVIRHGDMWLRIESHRGDQKATASYPLDDREYRFVEERSSVGGGISLRGNDVKTVWDGGKLVTLTRPFSLWVPDEHEMGDVPNTSSMEFLSIRSLSADGQEMIVERVSRHDWGWGFDGRQPSAAYARITDVYRRAP